MQTTSPVGPIEGLILSAASKDITVTAAGPGAWNLASRSGQSAAITPHPLNGFILKTTGCEPINAQGIRPTHTEYVEKIYGDFGALSYALGQLRAAARQTL